MFNTILGLTKKIPNGKVASYKEIAQRLNLHPRVVAKALACNKHPIIIPCHRVVHADGRIGGYTPKGQQEKIRLLKKEGVKVTDGRIPKEYFYRFI
jgi:methylated-DNA-[protein]-cysteine S-methyltransferase